MSKIKINKIDKNIIRALEKIPFPLFDYRHNILLFLKDEKARSNQSRSEHIARSFHGLTLKDIEQIPKEIMRSKLKQDPSRKGTYNYYLQRKGNKSKYIKVSIQIDKKDNRKAYIKTIYLTKVKK